MKKTQTAPQDSTPQQGQLNCLCLGLGPKLTEMLACRSGEASNHIRNARIELLKAVRALIDERIEQLARAQKTKGTSVPVE
jgi:hypothetical protein